MNEPKISIVVLAFDNSEALNKTLTTLVRNTDYPNFEVIVPVNPSGDETLDSKVKKVVTFFEVEHKIKAVFLKENLFHARGCMEGFKLSEGELICFCNDDIFIPASQSDWLTKMVNFLLSDENIATLTPAMYSIKERVYWIGKSNAEKSYHDFLHIPRGDPSLPTRPVETCYNNMAIHLTRRYLIEEIPLGQSCPHYGSDKEYCDRIREKYPNMKHIVLPEVKVYHFNIFNQRINHGKEKKIEG